MAKRAENDRIVNNFSMISVPLKINKLGTGGGIGTGEVASGKNAISSSGGVKASLVDFARKFPVKSKRQLAERVATAMKDPKGSVAGASEGLLNSAMRSALARICYTNETMIRVKNSLIAPVFLAVGTVLSPWLGPKLFCDSLVREVIKS
jgi:hypothetical protein